MSVEGRVVVITGSSRGIGLHLADRFAAAGARVVGCSRNPRDGASGDYTHFRLDLGDERAVCAMFHAIRNSHGTVDVLINNAGVASMNHAMLTPMATLDSLYRTNLAGTFLCCREAAKLMARKGKGGRIVNFSTVAVPMRLEGEAVYAATKAAVESLTRTLAREFAPMNITVNAVGPSPVDTDLLRGVPAEKIRALIARQAIPRIGTLEDVANVVEFFIKPQSAFISGQVLYLGGA